MIMTPLRFSIKPVHKFTILLLLILSAQLCIAGTLDDFESGLSQDSSSKHYSETTNHYSSDDDCDTVIGCLINLIINISFDLNESSYSDPVSDQPDSYYQNENELIHLKSRVSLGLFIENDENIQASNLKFGFYEEEGFIELEYIGYLEKPINDRLTVFNLPISIQHLAESNYSTHLLFGISTIFAKNEYAGFNLGYGLRYHINDSVALYIDPRIVFFEQDIMTDSTTGIRLSIDNIVVNTGYRRLKIDNVDLSNAFIQFGYQF